MVDFRPFEGLEFDTRIAGDFGTLISPPYDVVDAALRAKLASRNPYNIIRVTLPEAARGLDKYAAAGELVRRWMSEGALIRAPQSFYVIEQRFTLPGRELVRAAVCGHARLAPWREGGIYPHEVTLPKPRADRLSLYRATKMQHGPVFSLFEDAGGKVAAVIAAVKAAPVYREADGPEGSYDRVWRVTDPATIDKLVREFAKERFFIADGHHRYETALAYRDELAAGKPLPADHPANFVLMCAVPFDDPGLVILPTHRLLCLDSAEVADVGLRALAEDYKVKEAGGLDGLRCLCDRPCPTIGIYARGRMVLINMKDAARKAFRARAGELMADLNVFEVREKVLPRFFRDVAVATDRERIKYTHDFAQAVARVDSGECQAAVILSPVTVRHVAAVAGAGRTMPPKSTYFYPKLPTGVVLKPLE